MSPRILRYCAAVAAVAVMAGAWCPEISAQDKPVYLTATIPGGFESVNPVAIYTPDDLYEYINGQAVFYLSYRFTRLEHGHYRKGDVEYYIDVYELGSPLSAFGAFRQQRETNAVPLDAGAEGAITDYLAVFYKGKFYVEIIPMSSGADDVSNMHQLATHVDGVLPGGDDIPEAVSMFPQVWLEEGSERYVDESLASYGFLGRGLSATYELPEQERESRVFVSMWDDAAGARTAFTEYRGRLEEPVQVSIGGAEGIIGAEPYRGTTIVVLLDGNVVGIHGASNEAAAISVLHGLIDTMRSAGA